MRRGIVHMAVVAVSVALVLFGLPLGVAARSIILGEERSELERAALLTAQAVSPDIGAGDPVEIPLVEADKEVAVYDAGLVLRSSPGTGPTTPDDVTRAALGGVPRDSVVDGRLVVAQPVSVGERVIAVVRVSAPESSVTSWVLAVWGAMALLALLALAAAALVARRQAARLSRPLEVLAADAARVVGGDLTVRTPVHGAAAEIRRVTSAQNAVLDRLTDLLHRERRFTADVSHQLRTPLTGLSLIAQNALMAREADPQADLGPALLEVSAQVRTLERTVDELLNLARREIAEREGSATDDLTTVGELSAAVERRWHGPLAALGRPLVVDTSEIDAGTDIPAFTADEVLTSLLENAIRHGRGRVTVTFRDLGQTTAIDVADEGRLPPDAGRLFVRGRSGGAGTGIGLAIARSVAEARGGRVRVSSSEPTRFTLLLPRPRVTAPTT